MSLKFFHEGPIDNKSALVQVMVWRPTGVKPLTQPLLPQYLPRNVWASIKISPKFVSKSPIDKKWALVQVMVWRRQATSHYLNQGCPSSQTHMWDTTGRWVNTSLLMQPWSVSICNTLRNTSFRGHHTKVRMRAGLRSDQLWSLAIWESFHCHCPRCSQQRVDRRAQCQTTPKQGWVLWG